MPELSRAPAAAPGAADAYPPGYTGERKGSVITRRVAGEISGSKEDVLGEKKSGRASPGPRKTMFAASDDDGGGGEGRRSMRTGRKSMAGRQSMTSNRWSMRRSMRKSRHTGGADGMSADLAALKVSRVSYAAWPSRQSMAQSYNHAHYSLTDEDEGIGDLKMMLSRPSAAQRQSVAASVRRTGAIREDDEEEGEDGEAYDSLNRWPTWASAARAAATNAGAVAASAGGGLRAGAPRSSCSVLPGGGSAAGALRARRRRRHGRRRARSLSCRRRGPRAAGPTTARSDAEPPTKQLGKDARFSVRTSPGRSGTMIPTWTKRRPSRARWRRRT